MATAYGNQVAYGSGGWFRAVIDVWDAGPNTGTSTTVWYQYSVQFGTSVSDSTNNVNWSDPWGSGSANNFGFSFGSGGGQAVVGGPWSNPGPIQYGGGNQLHFEMAVQGIAGVGGTSTAVFNYSMPARTPSAPNPPIIAVGSIGATSASPWTVAAGDENGATTTQVNYRLHRASDGAHIGDIWGGYGGVTFTGLTRNTGYVAYAQSYNSAGWGGWSAGVGFTTLSTVPSAPTGLTVNSYLQDSASLSWSAPADNGGQSITNYQLEINTSPSFAAGGLVGIFNTGAVTGLMPSTTYYARVRASNSVGWGAWSGSVSFTTLAGAYVKVASTWRTVRWWLKINGTWVVAKQWKKISGNWTL